MFVVLNSLDQVKIWELLKFFIRWRVKELEDTVKQLLEENVAKTEEVDELKGMVKKLQHELEAKKDEVEERMKIIEEQMSCMVHKFRGQLHHDFPLH